MTPSPKKHGMTKQQTGALVSIAHTLHGAAGCFAKPDVGTRKLQVQSERVQAHCIKAIGSIGGLVLVNKDGHREISPALKRQAQRTMDEFTAAASLHLQRRQLYTSCFVAARVMACHYAIDDMARRVAAPKEWRRLEGVTYTLLKMLLVDLGQDEAAMFAVAESFIGRVAA